MAEQILKAVPYPRTNNGPWWGPVCPIHPTYFGANEPTDVERCCAEAFAEALACGHHSHN